MDIRIGNGIDVHKLVQGEKFILGGIQINSNNGILAHSDGDIVLHALIDSILGALSLGDIGTFFPSDNQKFKNISSQLLLDKVIDKMNSLNYNIINTDITIILQKPSLANYKDKIKKNLSKILKIDINKISIKATTTDYLGFLGKQEGIAVLVTTLLNQNES
tara:strand:+ start:267 stop:752 length:486 start_codon:yes stop_codon:yes gene_type:complete